MLLLQEGYNLLVDQALTVLLVELFVLKLLVILFLLDVLLKLNSPKEVLVQADPVAAAEADQAEKILWAEKLFFLMIPQN